MGRKSRLKRERRAAKVASQSAKSIVHDFEAICVSIRTLISRYRADDVFVSLCVSNLWLPNISSQIKHTLAWIVALSMPASIFAGDVRIKSYSDFTSFLKSLYALMPSFPSLEDYIPEADWGEIHYISKGVPLQIFYGGAIERISDFITAFLLVHGAKTQAVEDMHLALVAQDQMLKGVDASSEGSADSIKTGHIEIPSEDFWRQCHATTLDISERLDFADVSSELIMSLGASKLPASMSEFADSIVTGTALPGFVVNIGECHYPVALRNSVAAVIEYWASKTNICPPAAIADFISARMRDVIKGPLYIVTRSELQPFVYAAVILGGAKPYFVIALEEAQLEQLPQIEDYLKSALSTGDWALQRIGDTGATQIRNHDGVPTKLDQIGILAVLSRVTTALGYLNLPRTKAHFLSLPDFVSIIDSVEDVDELVRYWEFIDSTHGVVGPFSGPADQFAAFRDSHALLVDGALEPTMITLDPHWGSNWRYRLLTEYWDNAPPLLPDSPQTEWNVECDHDGLYRLIGRGVLAMSRSTVIGDCSVHFVMNLSQQPLEADDARIMELLVHCLADALNQRKSIFCELPLFTHKKIVTTCHAAQESLATQEVQECSERPLFSNWQVFTEKESESISFTVQANLQHVQDRLINATDASFEVSASLAWLDGVTTAMMQTIDPKVVEALISTSVQPARFTMTIAHQSIDVPDYASPNVPGPGNYKLARRDLAIVFKELGAQEGRYELAEAKPLIDSARDRFRSLVHERISALSRYALAEYCINQLDELATKYDRDHRKIELSLTHEVSYDRAAALAEAHDQFIKESRNYRYLLECCLSMSESGALSVQDDEVIQIIASIDWLLVLYNASDVLHHGIDVAGLELDHLYIPHVFYAELAGDSDSSFALESADFKLGVGLNTEDEVNTTLDDEGSWGELNKAFLQDAGVSFESFLSVLHVLSRWPTFIESPDLRFSYSAPQDLMRETLVKTISDMDYDEADKAISLLTLKPGNIRKLLGKSTIEGDVPIWEHTKRGDRYTIKPLIIDDNHNIIWGAAMTERTARIWHQNFTNGYMPADFDWPNVKVVVRSIKEGLEMNLEIAVARILSRATPYVEGGVDFKYRFPKEQFDDVGDYDGLAYWPERNLWVTAECKYNQPTFCLKDARRLRDRIFGKQEGKQQFAKIELRRAFLNENLEEIRSLLGWPNPAPGVPLTLHELYVSRDIYWWLRNPPYPVPTQFVRIDGLDNWLRTNGLLC